MARDILETVHALRLHANMGHLQNKNLYIWMQPRPCANKAEYLIMSLIERLHICLHGGEKGKYENEFFRFLYMEKHKEMHIHKKKA